MTVEFNIPLKILVTGSRGKSSLVRLIHSALLANGVNAYGRITGVIPRELSPNGDVQILRSSGGHVEEMKWWLSSLPSDVGGIVLENSAVSADLQGLASIWMKPEVTVITSVDPDHQEAWGPSEEDAAGVLSNGVERGSVVILGSGLEKKDFLVDTLLSKGCRMINAKVPEGSMLDHRKRNKALALEVCSFFGLDLEIFARAMEDLPSDIADFQIFSVNGRELAFAFSVNDLRNTQELFKNLGWSHEETVLIYNHRKDRSARLKSFRSWIVDNSWHSVFITGSRPLFPWARKYYGPVKDLASILSEVEGERVFGCGNVAGPPLEFLFEREGQS